MSGMLEDGPRPRPPAAAVLLVPVLLSLVVQVPAAVVIAVTTEQAPARGIAEVVVAAVGPLALLAARRLPGPTVAVVAAAALGDLLLGPDLGPPYIALGFAIALAVARGALLWALLSVGIVWLCAFLLAPSVGIVWPPPRIAFTTVVLAACFGVGWFVRARRERAVALRAQEAQRRRETLEAQRLSIANDLHDVLGHSLSLINVQAGVALHLPDRDPGHAREALEHIKEASRSALDEVRGVLGAVRGESGDEAPLIPQQGLADITGLVAGVRAAGLVVELDAGLDTMTSVPWAVQAAAYRVVQEALTNVLRHAAASRASVVVERDPGELAITIDDDGRGMGDADPGVGLLSMRSRVELLGGRLEAGPAPWGGTRIRVRLPWREDA